MGAGCETRRLTIPIMPPLVGPPHPAVVWTEPFDELNPQRWHEVSVHGHTEYEAVALDARRCLRAKSEMGASLLVTHVQFHPQTYPTLSWEWRVDRLVDGEALDRKEGSDAAARVYVYFATPGLAWQKRSLDYVWSASLPVGTMLSSAYLSQSKMIIAESGSTFLGQWRKVVRNLREDYIQAFGTEPPEVVAIGVMSDADNTQGHALAYFDDFRIGDAR